MKKILILPLFLNILFLSSCNPVKSTSGAEAGVVEFHKQFDAGDFDKIFDTAHADFKASQPKEKVVEFLSAVHGKLGKVKSTRRVSWKVNSFNLKTNVILVYKTEFEKGSGVERFIFRIQDGKAGLYNWNVNSRELIVGPAKGKQKEAAPEEKAEKPGKSPQN